MHKEDKIDFQAESFDNYFGVYVSKMTQEHRASLSPNILFRLFKKKGKQEFEKVSFFKKWYILMRAFKKRLFIVIEDQVNGLTPEQFIEFKNRKKRQEPGVADAEELIGHGVCVLGNSDLVNWLAHLNGICDGPTYNYAIKIKNNQSVKFPQISKEIAYFSSVLFNYEFNKVKFFREREFGQVEFLILLYLYDGGQKESTPFYTQILKGYPGCGRRTTMDGFRRMESMGYITKLGVTNFTGYRITDLGKQVYHEILKKYIIP